MFRSNLLLNRSRLIPVYRSFCQPSQKKYIIRLNDGVKPIANGSQILKEFHAKQQKSLKQIGIVQWARLIGMVRKLLLKSQQQAITMLKNSKIPEMMSDMKKQQVKKLQTKITSVKKTLTVDELRKLPQHVQHKWIIVRASKGFKTFVCMPSRIAEHSRIVALRVCHYWNIFIQSKFKAQLVQLIMWTWINSVKITKTIIKFIYEAYFEKTKPLK